MTPDEATQARRDAAIKRGRRIDALDGGQLLNFIHRLAAIVPGDVDRVLTEFAANAPKTRAEPRLHPVTFGAGRTGGLTAVCHLKACTPWHVHVEDGRGLPELERLVREHSGIEPS